MKKDNKKTLYESIMTSVAKEVKKALNELSSDTYLNAGNKTYDLLNNPNKTYSNHERQKLTARMNKFYNKWEELEAEKIYKQLDELFSTFAVDRIDDWDKLHEIFEIIHYGDYEHVVDEIENNIRERLINVFQRLISKGYKYQLNYHYYRHLKYGFNSLKNSICYQTNDEDQDFPEFIFGKSKKAIVDTCMQVNDDPYFVDYHDGKLDKDDIYDRIQPINIDDMITFYMDNDGNVYMY